MNISPQNHHIEMNLAKKVYFTFLITSFIWIILIILAPVFAGNGGTEGNLSDFIYIFFSSVCHQEDGRSFHISGHILGVCSRCLWVYIGFFIGISLYPLKFKLNNTDSPNLLILISVSFLMFLDVFLDMTGIFINTFFSRSITGFLVGIILPFYLIPGFVKFFYEINSFLRNKMSYKN